MPKGTTAAAWDLQHASPRSKPLGHDTSLGDFNQDKSTLSLSPTIKGRILQVESGDGEGLPEFEKRALIGIPDIANLLITKEP